MICICPPCRGRRGAGTSCRWRRSALLARESTAPASCTSTSCRTNLVSNIINLDQFVLLYIPDHIHIIIRAIVNYNQQLNVKTTTINSDQLTGSDKKNIEPTERKTLKKQNKPMRNETTPRTPTYRYPFHISCFSSTNSMSRLRSWGLARTRKMQTSCRTAPAMKKVQKVRTRGPSRLMFSVPFRYRFLSHYKQIYIYIYIYIRKKAIYTFFF